MGLPAKLVHPQGVLAKEETTYGTPVSLSASTDGAKLQFDDRNVATLGELTYAFDGSMGPAIASGAPRRRVAPAGRAYRGTFPFREKGYGAAYSAANAPAHHRFIKACGYDATVSTVGGSENWIYDPTAEGLTFTVLTVEAYARGKKYPMSAWLASLMIESKNQAPPVWTVDYRAIANGLPTDVALPAITYPNESLVEPLASSMSCVIGDFLTATVMGFSFKQNRGIDFARVPLTGSSAHLGFIPQGRAAELTLSIEETALVGSPFHTSSGLNQHQLYELATSLSVSLTVGGTQYNRYKINGNGQLSAPPKENANGPVAMIDLTFAFHSTADTLNDDHRLTFD